VRRVEVNVFREAEDAAERIRLYQDCAFRFLQQKQRFDLRCVGGSDSPPGRLSFLGVPEFGRDRFRELIGRVTERTLDRGQRTDYERIGEAQFAENYDRLMRDIDSSDSLWRVGISGGEIVGLVIPQLSGKSLGLINYVGVLPPFRGNGFGMELLREGVDLLIRRDLDRIVADIDIENFPLDQSLTALGFERKGEFACYVRDIAPFA